MSEKTITVTSRKQFRDWLAKNYDTETKVYVIKYKKHTGKRALTNKEAMEEAICFGWIDTTIKRVDEDRYQQCFVRRGKNSRWSRNTQRYAKELIAQGKMTPFGLKMYKEGLQKPVIDHDVPKNPDTPLPLKKALQKKKLLKTFEALSPSARRLHIIMYVRAVRPETKEKRINEIIVALQNK